MITLLPRISVQGSREDAGADVMLQEIDNLVELQKDIIQTLTSTQEGKEELEQAKQTLIDQVRFRMLMLSWILRNRSKVSKLW